MANPAEAFRDAIKAAGLIPPAAVEADGKLRRFPSNGKRGDDSGWYVLHPDGIPAGSFGDWRSGVSQTWRADIGRKLSPPEEAAYRLKIDAQRRAREAEEADRRERARLQAEEIWKRAGPVESHGYLASKGIRPNGARLYRGPLIISGLRCDGCLVVPLRDTEGQIWTLEFISPNGEKRFLPNGDKRGHYYPIGKPADKIIICEGYATGASLHEVTGEGVANAMDAGNLLPVARALRSKYPHTTLIIAADNDQWTEGNPGITKAKEAAQAANAGLVWPQFKDSEGKPTDFNDLHQREGAEAIIAQLASVQKIHTPDVLTKLTEGGNPSESGLLSVLSVGKDSTFPKPQPLPEGLPPVADFDFALLPDTLQNWARDICERVQCPPDYVGVTIMAALGSVIGRKVGIRPQGRTDWTEYPNQWALSVGRPGVLKSPAMEAALSPLKRLALQASESYRVESAEYERGSKLTKIRMEAAEKTAREKLRKNQNADVSMDLMIEEADAPTLKRYIANDTSAESLGELHRQNPNGILVFRDELVSLLKGLDREESAAARGFYLTGWNGNSPYTFDRIGRGLHLHIPAVCLSLLGSTQPGRIAEYLRAAVKGGAGDDGLIQRFGLLVWPDVGNTWRDVDRWPDTEARRAANEVFEKLDKLDASGIGGQQDDFDQSWYLRFDDEAICLFREWREGWEAKLRSGDLHPALESHLAKYRKLVPSLALILHLANGGSGPVSKRATLQALAWGEYLETHARRAYASVTSPEVTAAKAIIEKLRKGELSRTFAARDVYRRGWAHLSDRQHVLDALQLLADLDRLLVHTQTTEGRTATVYEANPRGLEA